MTGHSFPEQAAIRAALNSVYDPCSVSAGAPVTVLEMGLILGWEIDAECNVGVRMRLTSPGCTLAPSFMEKIELAVSRVPYVASVKVHITGNSLWSELEMAPTSLRKLQEVRKASLERTGAGPRQWRIQDSQKAAPVSDEAVRQ